MNSTMHAIDWAIVAFGLVGLTLFSLSTSRLMQGVADFLSANRSAGRYLLTIAGSMSGVGAISVVAIFESYYAAGFPPVWWSLMSIPVGVVIIISGWVYYRFRETRCMTLAQFFEVRYSRKFRIYSGVVTWGSGVVNFGIFPAVAARFFVYFVGLPVEFQLASVTVPTFAPVMLVTLGLALAYTCMGGQITVMITDALQGIICGFGFIIICIFLLYTFTWADIEQAVLARPEMAAKEQYKKESKSHLEDNEKAKKEAEQLTAAKQDEADQVITRARKRADEMTAKAEQKIAKAQAALDSGETTDEVALRSAQRELTVKQAEGRASIARAQIKAELIIAQGKADVDQSQVDSELRTAKAQIADQNAQDDELLTKEASEKSITHPYRTSKVADFNVWFYLIGVFGAFYGASSWQGSQAYASSGRSPHEQKMGQIIGLWRNLPLNAMLVLMPVCALVVLGLDKYAETATAVNAVLADAPNATIRTQVTVPVVLANVLPMGIKGLFCAMMLFFLITTQDTYLHSWGSIFVQDVVLPFRKNPLTPKQHVWMLRFSITFVAVFAFIFSLLFKQSTYILMFFAITGAIVSGHGAVIVGGLYWRRGSAAAAWTAMTLGWVLALGSIGCQQIQERLYPDVPEEARAAMIDFLYYINGINGQIQWFWIMIACLGSYVGVSLLGSALAEPFNLEKMLHRGKYNVSGDHFRAEDAARSLWWKITGITEEFTATDRFLAIALVVWNFGWFGIFILGTIYNLWINPDVSNETWSAFWRIWIWLHVIIGIPATIWFTVGGIHDIKDLFKTLLSTERNALDDGRVVDHHNVVDEDNAKD